MSFSSLPRQAVSLLRSLLQIRFVQELITMQFSGIIVLVIGLVKSIAFTRLLGANQYGIYAIALSTSNVFSSFTNLGQNQAAAIFFSEAYYRKDQARVIAVMRYYLVLSLLGLGLLLIFSAAAPWFVPQQATGTLLLVRLCFLSLGAGMFNEFFILILQTLRKIKLMSILENVGLLLQLIFAILFWLSGWGLAGLFFGHFVSNLCMLTLYISFYIKTRKESSLPSFWKIVRSRESIRPFLGQGLWISIDKNIGNLFPQVPLYILSYVSPPALIGFLSLAYNISRLPNSLFLAPVSRLANTTLPAISAQGAATLRKTVAAIMKHAMAMHGATTIGSLIFLPFLTLLLYGLEYSPVIEILPWMILIQMLSALTVVNSPLLRLLRKAHIPVFVQICTLPIEIGTLFFSITVMSPAKAFLLSYLLYYGSSLILTAYVLHAFKTKSFGAQTAS